MRHLFVINPVAGQKKSTQELVARIAAAFPDGNYELFYTAGTGDAVQAARSAAQTGEPVRIYACGGDGTLGEVVNGAAGWANAAVTNVPKGTGNDFLRIFGPHAKTRFADLAALSAGPQAAMDLMDCNGTLGIGVICAGVDARVAADMHKYKALPLVTGTGAYVLSLIVNVLFKGITRPTVIDTEGVHMAGETAIICICNGRYYGGGFMPVAEAMPDDGILDMLVVPDIDRRTFARLVGKYAKGRYRECPGVVRDFHGTAITYSSEEEIVTVVDGEVLRGRSFTVKLSDKKVNFFYPAGMSYRGTR